MDLNFCPVFVLISWFQMSGLRRAVSRAAREQAGFNVNGSSIAILMLTPETPGPDRNFDEKV